MPKVRWALTIFCILTLFGVVPLPAQKKSQQQENGPTDRSLSAEELFRQISPSVWVVEATGITGTTQGSAVAISSNIAVTNCHVVEGIFRDADVSTSILRLADRTTDAGDQNGFNAAEVVSRRLFGLGLDELSSASKVAPKVMLRKGDRRWRVFALGRRTSSSDICLLFIPGKEDPDRYFHPVARSRSEQTLQVGERVFAIGAPEGLDLTLSEGIISRLETWRPEEEADVEPIVVQIQTTAAISPGSSGGGLFDREGRLIGITTSTIKGAQNLNFALPMFDLRFLVNAMHLHLPLIDDQ